MYRKIIEKLKNKNIAILGFGMEGKSTYRFIRRYLSDQKITIIDKNDVLPTNLDLLKNDSNISYIFGDTYLDNLSHYDLIIKSPGISFKDIDVSEFEDRITSQLELFLEINSFNVIGITGTKGKSTTSSLMYEVLKNNGVDTYLLGNIGHPILDDIENYNSNTKLVIEMSSHQLEFIKASPHIGVVLNLFEDHLDHAGSVKHYHDCKMNMFRYQTENDISIYCSDNEALNNYVNDYDFKSIKYRVRLDNLDKNTNTVLLDGPYVKCNGLNLYNENDSRNLIGKHNLENIMVVLLISKLLNLDLDKTRSAINDFKPLEHRLELVGTYNGVTYYNDTIATIPYATINGIEALGKVDTLIFGGMDRHIDYEPLIDYLEKSTITNLICMPSTGYKIGEILKNKNIDKKIYFTQTLEEAVKIAKEKTKKEMICLLSPAAPSYEYYKNFEEKGNAYKNLIKEG